MNQAQKTTQDLLDFIAASPTPFHCVAQTQRRLQAAGFTPLAEGERWKLEPQGAHYVIRDGGVVAFRLGSRPAHEAGFRVVGAHTDSPTLRVKPIPDVSKEGYRQLGVEMYGGSLAFTWLDRDLGLAGQVVLQGENSGDPLEHRLVNIAEPILRVPTIAIHLHREVKEKLELNNQKHMAPIMGLAPTDNGDEGKNADKNAGKEAGQPGALLQLLGSRLDVDPERILSWELSVQDCVPPVIGGVDGEFVFAPRLDNQAMCHAALVALLRAGGQQSDATQMICLYDHEEAGSGSVSGAAGSFGEDILRRVAEVEGPGAEAGALSRAMAHSTQISADMAHAIHPNWADQHEPSHQPKLNEGPVIKINANQRYATSARSAGMFAALCRELEVPYQQYVNRNDIPCGSTIGPISSSRLGINTVDVGNPMLSMHSIRELGGSKDPEWMTAVMTGFFVS